MSKPKILSNMKITQGSENVQNADHLIDRKWLKISQE